MSAPFAGLLRPVGVVLIAFLVRASVVEHEHLEAVLGVIHADRANDRHGEQFGVLVIGRDENVDRGQFVVGQIGRRRALQRVGDHEQADRQHHGAVNLCDIEKNAGYEICGVGDRRQGVDRAPEKIAQDDRSAQHQENVPPDALQPQCADAGHKRKRDDPDDELSADADRFRGEGDKPHSPRGPKGRPHPRVHQTLTHSLPSPDED